MGNDGGCGRGVRPSCSDDEQKRRERERYERVKILLGNGLCKNQ